VFCTKKFGVNEQFTATVDEYREKVVLTSRRQEKGAWEVRLEVLDASAALDTKAASEESTVEATTGRVDHPYGSSSIVMTRIARALHKVRDEHENELTHRDDVIGALSMKHKNQQSVARVFAAWRQVRVQTLEHKEKMYRAARFLGDKLLTHRRRAFSKWREHAERVKVAALRADECAS
jgi:ribosome-associated translation inhibitor RaiA